MNDRAVNAAIADIIATEFGGHDPGYQASPIKRKRRTKAEVAALDEAIYAVAQENQPATVRQIYYRLVSAGAIPKTENEYDNIGRRLGILRRARVLPFGWIADNTRWQRKPNTYSGLRQALIDTARFYRRTVWNNLPVYCEVWLEKDALAGVLYDVTAEYDVPLMVTRGYASLSYIYEAAEAIAARGKPTYIYYFGDHDPSGINIPIKVAEGLKEFAPEAEIHFQRVAVVPWQIEEWKLPTRPTKKSDSRSKTFKGESVEVDAIPPDTLRALARGCIEQHIPEGTMDTLEVAEESERDILLSFAKELER